MFDATGSRRDLEKDMEKALEAEFGFECTTFVRTAAELAKTLAATPFDVAASDTHFVTFLKKAPSASAAKELEALSNDFDTLVVQGADVHWRMHGTSITEHPRETPLGEGARPAELDEPQRQDAHQALGEARFLGRSRRPVRIRVDRVPHARRSPGSWSS